MLAGCSASAADVAADLTSEGVPDCGDGRVDGRVGQRLVGRLEGESVGQADLVGLERRSLVTVEKRDAGQKLAGTFTDRRLDLRGRLITPDNDGDVAFEQRQRVRRLDLRTPVDERCDDVEIDQREGDVL